MRRLFLLRAYGDFVIAIRSAMLSPKTTGIKIITDQSNTSDTSIRYAKVSFSKSNIPLDYLFIGRHVSRGFNWCIFCHLFIYRNLTIT